MDISPQQLQASYAACRRITRRAGSSFPAAFLLLPREKRRAMDALYAFMRHSDDLVDGPQADHLPQELLTHWRASFDQALLGCFDRSEVRRRIAAGSGVPGGWKGTTGASVALGIYRVDDEIAQSILPAVADTIQRFHIPPEHLRAVLDGVELDLHTSNYETFDELRTYCELVASAVGLACIHIWGFEGPHATEPARCTGIAFQLTNILRDLREDVEDGRVYLPLADLRECGYSIEELRRGVANPAFRRLMELEIGRAEDFYRQGSELFTRLEPDGQRIFGVMMATYRTLLKEIKRRPNEVLVRRIELSWPRKLRIAARWALFAPSASGLA